MGTLFVISPAIETYFKDYGSGQRQFTWENNLECLLVNDNAIYDSIEFRLHSLLTTGHPQLGRSS